MPASTESPPNIFVSVTTQQYEAMKVFFPGIVKLDEMPKQVKPPDTRKHKSRLVIEAYFKKKYPFS